MAGWFLLKSRRNPHGTERTFHWRLGSHSLCPIVLLSYPVSFFAGELPDIPAPKGYCWCAGSSVWLKNRGSFKLPTGSRVLAAFRVGSGRCRIWAQTWVGSWQGSLPPDWSCDPGFFTDLCLTSEPVDTTLGITVSRFTGHSSALGKAFQKLMGL